ncbi:MAG: hypothetical protein FJ214_08380 [Ignavibacteria bacterium]|nr:hypothetical protein [Ignavibacteria bacterium]
MVPIILKRENSSDIRLSIEEFRNDFLTVCQTHHSERRALVFAFLLYDFDNPNISQILRNPDYWTALDYLSGKYLSIFYIHTKNEKLFNEKEFSPVFYDMLPVIGRESPFKESKTILEKYFGIDSSLKLPSILFFQVKENYVSNYLFVELKSNTLEPLFNELMDTVKEVVESLKNVRKEYYENYDEVFDVIKTTIRNKKELKFITKVIKKIPITKILDWILS